MAHHQHSFCKGHSTTTALHRIQEQISKGKFSTRYPMANYFQTCIIRQCQHTSKEVFKYIRGRYNYVEYQHVKSNQCKMKQGALKVVLCFMAVEPLHEIPSPLQFIFLVSFADDCPHHLNRPRHPTTMCQIKRLPGNFIKLVFVQKSQTISGKVVCYFIHFLDKERRLRFRLTSKLEITFYQQFSKPKILGVRLD